MTRAERVILLLRIAAEYIDEHADTSETIFYDDTDCDGSCLCEDLKNLAEDLEKEPSNEKR